MEFNKHNKTSLIEIVNKNLLSELINWLIKGKIQLDKTHKDLTHILIPNQIQYYQTLRRFLIKFWVRNYRINDQ